MFGGYGSLAVCCRLSLFLFCVVGFGLLVCGLGGCLGLVRWVILLWCYGGVWCFPGGFGCWVLLAVCWFRVMMLRILVCDLSCVFLV